ncbi:MAG TPA: hypothetical protein VNS09_15255 [Solirubrobacter sp.]|nr:hypothetical protein [Solirubrobacter sp.]
MTPLAQLVDALIDTADPVLTVTDNASDDEDAQALLGAMLARLEGLYAPRDLLIATAVLEAVTPMLVETNVLLTTQPVGRPV